VTDQTQGRGDSEATVTVEFLGLAEMRAGRSQWQLPARTIGQLLQELAVTFPQFVSREGGLQLRRSWIFNLNGDRFVTDPDTPLQPGDSILVMSLDAGG
jgi:molybdopterin converting factor small subunit